MKIALAQVNPVVGDFTYNCQRIRDAARNALEKGCDLVIFSELAVCGYPPRDLLEKKGFVKANLAALDDLINSIEGIGVLVGYVDKSAKPGGKPLHNAAALLENGKILTKVYKQLLPTYDVFDEHRFYEPGEPTRPIEYKGRRLGITICEDLWNDEDVFPDQRYHTHPGAHLSEQGVDFLINLSASPFHMGKIRLRRRLFGGIASKYNVPLLYANQVGGNDSLLFDGAGMAFDAQGRLIAQAKDFEEDLVVVDVAAGTRAVGTMRSIAPTDTESVIKALVTGTRDYLYKCGFQKVVIGLSGGIDSALTACIAVMATGAENVSLIFMPSGYTSQENYEDTRALANNLKADLEIIPIDPIFEAFTHKVSPDFVPGTPGVTEQNIQARIRGTILMAHSNKKGSLVLSTGNKSELAVGYCTLYGDMNGGLAVISDVPKTLVYELCHKVKEQYGYIPPRIIAKPPSAELAPDQTDQDDLPSYDVLDTILKAYVEDHKEVADIVEMGIERQLIEDVIRRVDRNEYKRHQAAPGLRVTSKAFGYGRRYPIAQRYRSS